MTATLFAIALLAGYTFALIRAIRSTPPLVTDKTERVFIASPGVV